jgi:hypothetical protein
MSGHERRYLSSSNFPKFGAPDSIPTLKKVDRFFLFCLLHFFGERRERRGHNKRATQKERVEAPPKCKALSTICLPPARCVNVEHAAALHTHAYSAPQIPFNSERRGKRGVSFSFCHIFGLYEPFVTSFSIHSTIRRVRASVLCSPSLWCRVLGFGSRV